VAKLNSYELVVLLRSDVEEDDRKAVLERAKEIITKDDGVITKVDEWGKKRLAYEIKHQGEAFYYVFQFRAKPETLAEVTRVLGITDTVLRFMAVRAPGSGGAQPTLAATEEST